MNLVTLWVARIDYDGALSTAAGHFKRTPMRYTWVKPAPECPCGDPGLSRLLFGGAAYFELDVVDKGAPLDGYGPTAQLAFVDKTPERALARLREYCRLQAQEAVATAVAYYEHTRQITARVGGAVAPKPLTVDVGMFIAFGAREVLEQLVQPARILLWAAAHSEAAGEFDWQEIIDAGAAAEKLLPIIAALDPTFEVQLDQLKSEE
jgi:hypothetical protein